MGYGVPGPVDATERRNIDGPKANRSAALADAKFAP